MLGFLPLAPSFSLSGNTGFREVPFILFKNTTGSQILTALVCTDVMPGEGMRRRAKAFSLPAWRCAKCLISQIFLKFHRCEAASANESFRGFLKSKVKGAKSGT